MNWYEALTRAHPAGIANWKLKWGKGMKVRKRFRHGDNSTDYPGEDALGERGTHSLEYLTSDADPDMPD